jgi:lipoprotein NlpI
MDDLSQAIEFEPMMLDAFWHRHLIYILLNKKQAALDDLNVVLKYNKSHVGAYKSRFVFSVKLYVSLQS